MPWYWWYLAIAVVVGTALSALLIWFAFLWLGRREPYGKVIRLPIRGKLVFLRLVLRDSRIPFYLKALPLAAIIYMVSPLDLIPGIAVDDVAFALMTLIVVIRFMPRPIAWN